MPKNLLYSLFGVIVALVVVIFVIVPATMPTGTIEVNTLRFDVQVANNPITRWQGLSGTLQESLRGEGMLFVYNEKAVRTFSMRGMKFPLDFAWIADGKVVAVDKNVQPPAEGEEPVTVTSSPIPVDMILEMPAGGLDRYGIVPGLLLHTP